MKKTPDKRPRGRPQRPPSKIYCFRDLQTKEPQFEKAARKAGFKRVSDWLKDFANKNS